MQIQVEDGKNGAILKVEGRIDTSTAPEFEARLMDELAKHSQLKIDLEQVVYISSAGLRAFLNAQKYVNKNRLEMSLFHVGDTVMEVFEMTGFIDILTVE